MDQQKLDDPIISLNNLKRFLENLISTKLVEKENGKGLSTNDLTDELKEAYDEAVIHSKSPHAPPDAMPNVIERIRYKDEFLPVGPHKTITLPNNIGGGGWDPDFVEDFIGDLIVIMDYYLDFNEVTKQDIDPLFEGWNIQYASDFQFQEVTDGDIDNIFAGRP